MWRGDSIGLTHDTGARSLVNLSNDESGLAALRWSNAGVDVAWTKVQVHLAALVLV